MRFWRRRARGRVTGFTVSATGIGVNWAYVASERELARNVLWLLEDHRVLYEPVAHENPNFCVNSANELRKELRAPIEQCRSDELRDSLRDIQAAAREFVTQVEKIARNNVDTSPDEYLKRWFRRRFHEALSAFRVPVGVQVALIVERFDLGVDGTLARILPPERHHKLTSDSWGVPNWWRPQRTDLSERETGEMASAHSPNTNGDAQLIGGRQVTSMLYGLTGGHRASTAMLVEAMRECPLKDGDTLEVLLDYRDPGRGPGRLEDSLRQWLLDKFPEDTYEDLVTCAAARTMQHAILLAEREKLLVGGFRSYEEITPVLWPAAGGARPVILRRLLLRQLAGRANDHAANWTTVVDCLRTGCAQDDALRDGDQYGVLYYAMANWDIATACEGLGQRLAADNTAAWVQLLRSVTSAPRRPANPDVPPMDQLRAAIDKRSEPLTRLVVARWIVFDPFISNRRRALHQQIAADYHFFVSTLAQGDPRLLLSEADYHLEQAELWS